ncbi:hypothetical protein Pth03_52220 [Planotetraspora thailandica]|uniref:N-acetyltransferase domain-containing protein n=1 Tax=Planotetraspora thailandica TaxID=487172 RepID=A0A8J3V3N5_9ACTN|nr:GNAT family N-acetyltransferase [Planotetraspora thailandica]GII56833.1 hypothetical protein Pth03_52220 [Planotetraspora thailandica]
MGDLELEISVDEVTRALLLTFEELVAAWPEARGVRGRHGTRLIVSGLPLPHLNGVFTDTREPDADEVAEFARTLAESSVPWCIQVRGEPTPELTEVAAHFGLNGRMQLPLMATTATDVEPASGPYSVRRIDAKDHEAYGVALAAGFEAPIEIMSRLAQPEILDMPGAAGYLVEVDGEPVATGFGLRVGDYLGIYNIATPPAHRRRGYGRAATEAVMRDGFADGVRVAFLQASTDGLPLYELLGFRTVETWTYLVRG